MRAWALMALAIPLICAARPGTDGAAAIEGIRVDYATMCTGVADRSPLGPGETFGADVGRLFCFTRIIGIREETTITHVWYAGDEKVFEYALAVRPPTWRTWSEKNIPPQRKGPWHVDVVGPGGEVLRTLEFAIQ